MKYNQPFDQPSNPNASYVDGNIAAGIQGSVVPAASVEFDQREVVEVINTAYARGYSDFSLTPCAAPANSDLTQLRKAIEGFIHGYYFGRILLTTPLTVYVRPGGDDTHDGLVNTDARAFRTIQGAVNTCCNKYDFNGQYIIIQLGVSAAYTGASFPMLPGYFVVQGNANAPDSYPITPIPIGGPTTQTIFNSVFQKVALIGVQLCFNYLGSPVNEQMVTINGSWVEFDIDHCSFYVPNDRPNLTCFNCANGARLITSGPLTAIARNAVTQIQTFIYAWNYGQFSLGYPGMASVMSCTNGMFNFNVAFASAYTGLIEIFNGNIGGGWTTSTGRKFQSLDNGVVRTFNQGINYLPGNTAGFTNNGGQYT